MKDRNGTKLVVIFCAALAVGCLWSQGSGWPERADAAATNGPNASAATLADNKRKARAAFTEAAKVFFSPRCVNCHPAGDTPRQGNEGREHDFEVKRGPDGRGMEPMVCASCHLEKNQDDEGLPPGAPDWHMPKPTQKMVFEGLSAGELCRNLKDPLKNGGKKSAKESVEHLATDPKVLWAWSPGRGRTAPPMSHADFLKKMNEWVTAGAACPE